MPSFDIVSEVDKQELDNAVNQARKELATRFDFKGITAEILLEKDKITLTAQDAGHLRGLREILIGKLSKRGVDLRNIEQDEPAISSVGHARQELKIQQGLEGNKAKEIIQAIKSQGFKVQSQLQDRQIRVTGKKKRRAPGSHSIHPQPRLWCRNKFQKFPGLTNSKEGRFPIRPFGTADWRPPLLDLYPPCTGGMIEISSPGESLKFRSTNSTPAPIKMLLSCCRSFGCCAINLLKQVADGGPIRNIDIQFAHSDQIAQLRVKLASTFIAFRLSASPLLRIEVRGFGAPFQ